MTDAPEQAALRDQCTVFLTGHGPGALLIELPQMPEYLGHAREIASALRGAPGVRVVPDPPHVSMMHLLLTATQEGFAAAARRLAAEQGVWTWPEAMVTPDPGVQRVELYVGDATRAVPPGRVRDIITALADG